MTPARVDPILAAKMRADRQMEPDLDAIQATYDFELRARQSRDEKLEAREGQVPEGPGPILYLFRLLSQRDRSRWAHLQ